MYTTLSHTHITKHAKCYWKTNMHAKHHSIITLYISHPLSCVICIITPLPQPPFSHPPLPPLAHYTKLIWVHPECSSPKIGREYGIHIHMYLTLPPYHPKPSLYTIYVRQTVNFGTSYSNRKYLKHILNLRYAVLYCNIVWCPVLLYYTWRAYLYVKHVHTMYMYLSQQYICT